MFVSPPRDPKVCATCGNNRFEEIDRKDRGEKAASCLLWLLSGCLIVLYPIEKWVIDPMLKRNYVRCTVCKQLKRRSLLTP